MKVGDSVELHIESLGFEGASIARVDGLVVFVEGGLPGDHVRATIRTKKKSFLNATIDEVLSASPSRIAPQCTHTEICGGCRWQHCDYATQIAWKQQHTVDCFERLGKIPFGELKPIIPSPRTFHYRNKMEFSFHDRRWVSSEELARGEEIVNRNFALGLHVPRRYDAIFTVDACFLQHEAANAILRLVREKALELKVEPYSTKQRQGFLRHLVLRRSEAEQEFMIVLVSSTPHTPDETAFVTWMHQELPSLISDACTIVHAVKDTTNPVARGEIASVTGNGYITEKVHDVAFRISPFSFFQTNSHQLHGFLDAIINAAHIQEHSSVWDLYCGTGSITLPAARHARTVLGIELSEESIDDAKHNAERNGIVNVRFAAADLHKAQTIDFLRGQETPDVVILDPPRAGIHPMLLQHLIMLRVPRIVYVSCNPATQARDCAILHEAYDVTSMQAVDMFPHTYHVENIATLKLRP